MVPRARATEHVQPAPLRGFFHPGAIFGAGARVGVVVWWVEMRHLGMYMLMNGSSAANWVPRWGLPSLIPFILQAQGFPEASTATLLGAFFPVRPPPPTSK